MGKLQPIMPGSPGEMWYIDIAGPISVASQKNWHLMVAIDYATRFTITALMHAVTTNMLITFLSEQVIGQFGTPRKFITDHGSTMMAKKFQVFLIHHGIKHQPMMGYHQQANRLVESDPNTQNHATSAAV